MSMAVGRTNYAVRGAVASGLTVLIVFAVSAWHTAGTDLSHADYFLAAGPLCGIVGGIAYGRRVGLPIVLALWFAIVGAIFLFPEPSTSLAKVVWMGIVTAFVFWVIGGALP